MTDRSEALLFGWLLIVGGAAITLLRNRLAIYRRDLDSGRRTARAQPKPTDLPIISGIFAALGVLLMLGGLLLIAEEPLLRLLGLG